MRKLKAACFALTAACAILASMPGRAAEFTITAVKALTGPLAFVGVPEVNAIRLAVEEINATHFLGEGNVLKLNVYDDQNDRAQILTALRRSALDDTLVVLGSANSALAMAIAPALNDAKIAFIATAATSAPIAVTPWYVKITQSPLATVTPVAAYAADKVNVQRLAIIYAHDNDGHTTNMKTFRDYLVSKGKKPLIEEPILSSDSNFATIATKVAQLDPDGIWIGTNASQAANIVLQLKEAGVAKDVALFGISSLGEDYIKAGGKAVDNTYMAMDYNHESKSPLNLRFIEAYKKRYNVSPDNFAAVGYSETYVAAQAIKDSLPNPTREKVMSSMTKLKDVPVLIGDGKWTIGPDRIPEYTQPVMVIKDGRLVTAP